MYPAPVKQKPKSQSFQTHLAIQEKMEVILLPMYSSHVCLDSPLDVQGIMIFGIGFSESNLRCFKDKKI